MKKTSLYTIASLMIVMPAIASQSQPASQPQPQTDTDEEILLVVECINGKWKITKAKNEEVIKETQADKLEGKPCRTSKPEY